jgi:polysaccharide chain length determinant protein (PEP-CTERM system associated)
LKNLDIQNAGGMDMAGQLSALSNQLNQSRLELREAVTARDSARKQLESEKNQTADTTARSLLHESAMAVSTPEMDARIESQRRTLDALLQRFTDKHPDVVSTQRLIGELEASRQTQVQALRKAAMSAPNMPSSNSLAYQDLSRLLANSEVLVASLSARVQEYERRFSQARESMKRAPQIEAEFAQLNRDYDINQKNYDDLVTRREKAALSGDLEAAAGVADFRLIDPPRASPQPVAPNRLLLMPLALVAAVAAGLLAAFVASQLRAVFYDARTLREVLGLPLLGVITLVMNEEQQRRERSDLRKFVAASSGLFVTFSAGMVIFSLMSGRAA